MSATRSDQQKSRPSAPEKKSDISVAGQVVNRRLDMPYDDDIFDTGFMRSAAFPGSNRQHKQVKGENAPKS